MLIKSIVLPLPFALVCFNWSRTTTLSVVAVVLEGHRSDCTEPFSLN